MLKVRILTAAVLACLLLTVLFWLPARWSVLAFGAAFLLGAWEWAGVGGLGGFPARASYALAIGLCMALAWRWTADPAHLLMLLRWTCGWWAVAFLWLSFAPASHRPPLTLCCGVPVLVPAFVALGRLQVANGFASGPQLVLLLLLLVFGADIGAFFAGRRFGRLKLAPRVSPSKTWEGAIGGLFAVAAIAWAGALYFGLPVAGAVGFGCAVGLISIVGDLTESMFKRSAGLKDSGNLLPGHGGILDRMDSISAAAPLYALGLFSARMLT